MGDAGTAALFPHWLPVASRRATPDKIGRISLALGTPPYKDYA